MQAELINQLANRGIVAEAVCKSYGDHLVLDKVSLAVARGTIFSLLGPNGTGKPKPGLWHFFGTRPGGRYEGGWRRIARRGGFRRPGRACEAVDHVRCYVDACPDASPRPLAELRAGDGGPPAARWRFTQAGGQPRCVPLRGWMRSRRCRLRPGRDELRRGRAARSGRSLAERSVSAQRSWRW